jgi:N-acetylglutamate synthase-like GNAT family acetyltransferase
MDNLTIRLATVDDLDEIMQLALMASDENGVVKARPERLLQDIWPAVNRDHGLVGCIGLPGGAIEGAILMRIGNLWYSDDLVLEEKAIFIHPEYRAAKGGRAKRLAEFSKQVSDTLGIPLVIGVLSNQRTEAKVRMYQRVFGDPSGAFFIYNARTGQHAQQVAEQ